MLPNISARLTKMCLGYLLGNCCRNLVPQESSMGKTKLYKSKPRPIHRHKNGKVGNPKNCPMMNSTLMEGGISNAGTSFLQDEVA